MKSRRDADQGVYADDAVHGRRRRRLVRVLGSGAASFLLAIGFLATSVASVPWNDFPTVEVEPEDAEPVSIGRIGATGIENGPTTVAQVLEILERAEVTAQEAGRARTPEVEQAAAELGTLLSTYTAQQRAAVDPRPGIGTTAPRVAVGTDVIPVGDASAVSDTVDSATDHAVDVPPGGDPVVEDPVVDESAVEDPAVEDPAVED
ncbi:MAG: hypothetical protein M3217_03005, partial [Actinomycetota bacterium]|nr:hypothetical protein [Actinomycetota bacterium]